jgi:hypothetical protein
MKKKIILSFKTAGIILMLTFFCTQVFSQSVFTSLSSQQQVQKPVSKGFYDPTLYPTDKQGGNTIGTATFIPSLPYTNTGTTSGYTNDYDEVCPYTGSTAPDVVYYFVANANGVVDIDLCGSLYDTKLYVYENAHTPGNPHACNDDYYSDAICGYYVSAIFGMPVTDGNTYYIVIDGYGAENGNYNISVSAISSPCVITCPPGSIPESELCGTDVNGGCNTDPTFPPFEAVNPNTTICGTLWADGGSRDTDWFEMVLTETSDVILHVDAQRAMFYGMIELSTPGNPSCASMTGFIEPFAAAGPCNPTSLVIGQLPAGTYWFFAAMDVYYDNPCDVDYWIEFEVIPVLTPYLSAIPNSLNLGYTPSGSYSASQMYMLSGDNLNPGPIGVSAPPGFEVSTDDMNWYASVTVTYTDPTLPPTPVYVRFAPTGPPATYSDYIENIGGGAVLDVAVSGTSMIQYCAAGPTSTFDSDLFRVQVNGPGTTFDHDVGCTGILGVQDFTALTGLTCNRANNIP